MTDRAETPEQRERLEAGQCPLCGDETVLHWEPTRTHPTGAYQRFQCPECEVEGTEDYARIGFTIFHWSQDGQPDDTYRTENA